MRRNIALASGAVAGLGLALFGVPVLLAVALGIGSYYLVNEWA